MENETKVTDVVPMPAGAEQPMAPDKKPAKESLLISGSILLGCLIIAGAILTLAPQRGTPTPTTAGTDQGAETEAPAVPAPKDTTAVTSLDDDPILGDRTKAKVAIVEYSDYECPYCQRFHKETFDQLVKDYVNTGKAVIAFRDFPLSFHEPNASLEAGVANCVRKEKGDKAYFAFSQNVFKETISNGKGLPAGKLDELIRQASANPITINACAASDEVKQEIAKDIADGGKAGISGNPSFVVGTLGSDGVVTGELLVGAQPLSGFATVIEKYLAK